MSSTLRSLVSRSPMLKRMAKRILTLVRGSSGASHSYEELPAGTRDSASAALRDSWQDKSLPATQRALVDTQLERFRHGDAIPVFDVMVDSLKKLTRGEPGRTVLEIGCSSGFYSEVFAIAGLPIAYSGCDYSSAFIDMAKTKYPQLPFQVSDATALSYADASYDIAISGCCLLHIPDYPRAITETARVAGRYAIFHRTPVLIGKPTTFYRKLAYGVPTIEIHFNEAEFIALLDANGLSVIETYSLSEEVNGQGSANRTYVCSKTGAFPGPPNAQDLQ